MTDKPKPTAAHIMAGAIIDAAAEMPSLKKGDVNKYGGYNYVSIDDYYEKVGAVARKHGLTWTMREVEAKHIGGTGKESFWSFTYDFTLMHASGEMLADVDRITIPHPWQGAQTAGSARSYAEKCFMRSLFKVVTGEGDADASDPKASIPAGPAPTQSPLPATAPQRQMTPPPFAMPAGSDGLDLPSDPVDDMNPPPDEPQDPPITDDFQAEIDAHQASQTLGRANLSNYTEVVETVSRESDLPLMKVPDNAAAPGHKWEMVVEVFRVWLPECKTVAKLQKFWTDNLRAIKLLEAVDRGRHAKVREMFNGRLEVLKKAEAEKGRK